MLGLFLALFVLGAIIGKPPATPQPVAAERAPATETTTTVPPVRYSVRQVLDAGTVLVTGANGVQQTVRVLGVQAPPGDGTGCYGQESVDWARGLLANQEITLRLAADAAAEAGTVTAALALPDGSDYATAALRTGHVRYLLGSGADEALRAAEQVASAARTGLWGAPCEGTIDVAPARPSSEYPLPAEPTVTEPAPEPPAPEPSVAAQATEAPPVTSNRERPVPDRTVAQEPTPAGYYKNCTAARAAGVAPLHRGEPGYSRKLDRDNDGIACE